MFVIVSEIRVCVRVCRGKDDRDRREEEDEESYPVL